MKNLVAGKNDFHNNIVSMCEAEVKFTLNSLHSLYQNPILFTEKTLWIVFLYPWVKKCIKQIFLQNNSYKYILWISPQKAEESDDTVIGNDEARWEKMAQFLVGKRIKTLKLMQKVYCHSLFIYYMLFIYLRS